MSSHHNMESRRISIPSCLTDVTSDWISDLLYKILQVPRPDNIAGTHNGITHLQIRAKSNEPGFRESCHVTVRCAGAPKKTFKMLVDIIPKDPELKEIIIRHDLFAKDILIHSKVLPLLQEYVQNRSKEHKAVDVSFCVPKFIYGDYDAHNGKGVIVLEDFSDEYRVRDPQLMLLDPVDVSEVVQNLATFHAICVAYQTSEQVGLEKIFPILSSGYAWFQDDMSHFVDEMYSTCRNFLKSIPGQESVLHWFEGKMSNPSEFHKAGQNASSKLKCIIHGDLWHNNLFFHKKSNEVLINDWQMCHIGNATNDLCFLLFSSTTPKFRKENWDNMLQSYYDCFVATLRSLDIPERQLSLSYEEFLVAVRASVPVSLFFCGNVQDFDVNSEAAMAREVEELSDLSDTDADEDELQEGAFRSLQSCFNFIESSESLFRGRKDVKEFPQIREVDENVGILLSFSDDGKENNLKEQEVKAELPPEAVSSGAESSASIGHLELLPHKALCKVPTIASDTDLETLERLKKEKRKLKLDDRKARAMRRKLYLDLYKEVSSKGFI